MFCAMGSWLTGAPKKTPRAIPHLFKPRFCLIGPRSRIGGTRGRLWKKKATNEIESAHRVVAWSWFGLAPVLRSRAGESRHGRGLGGRPNQYADRVDRHRGDIQFAGPLAGGAVRRDRGGLG